MSNKKGRINIVYSTNPDFNYQYEEQEEQATLPPEKQNLRVTLDSKQRAGKIVTLIDGFIGTEEDLKELAKLLKNKCGVGGSVKEGQIIIQGAFKDKILAILHDNNYRAH
ncbi:MAG: translation initiation factor [Odoribacter sp.]|nr:translation initiation factor [Odoribacter sp.]